MEWDADMEIKKILRISLVVVMMITAITPIAFATPNSESIHVTFTPTGTIVLDLYPITATFGDVTLNTQDNGPSEGAGDTVYTVYNNGTVDATVYIFSNWTTSGGDWALKNSASPSEDEYTLDITGSDAQYITNSNTSWISELDYSATVTFGIDLDIGYASGSGKLDAQITMINITATVKA